MRCVAAALLLASATSPALAHDLPEILVQKRDRHTQGRSRHVAGGVVKRAGTLETTVFDILTYTTGGAYYANISVGTPPQDQTVIVDTGSSDLYLDASTSQACESQGRHACRGGDFDPSKSSTYKIADPSPAFNTTFGDGSTAYGPYGLDTVTIGDVSLESAQFGVATTVDSSTGYALGLLGVGYSANEATRDVYPNIPEALALAGVINSRLFSVYLNDGEATSGSILFGGIDTDKYTGNLQTVDTLPDPITGFVDRFITVITDLSVNVDGQKTNIIKNGATGIGAYGRDNGGSQPVLLDTGSSAWSVSPALYDAIVRNFPYVETQRGTGLTRCENRDRSDSITVTFDGTIDIEVPVADFILPVYSPSNNQPVSLQGEDICVFMIAPAPPTGLDFQPAGDAILRAMYIVYDLDNGQMALAQSNPNSTSSNVQTVSAGPSGIAKAAKNVETAAANTFSVAASAPITVSPSAVTGRTTIGDATGTAAVPEDAQPANSNTVSPVRASGSAPPGSSIAASSSAPGSSPTTSKSAGSSLRPRGADWGAVYVSGATLVMAGFGFALML